MGGAGTPRDVCIVGAARTPCGGLLGSLASIKAPALAGIAIRGKRSLARGRDPQ